MGSRFRDRNGIVLEEFMDKQGLVVLNDGRPTRFQVNQGGSSCLDLTFTSPDLALRGEWDIMDRYTIGSDHVPILSRFGRKLFKEQDFRPRKYNYPKARWDEFRIRTQEETNNMCREDVDKWNNSLCNIKSNQITFIVTSPQHKCLGE